jgi:transposase
MAAPYSQDLRDKVLAAYDRGMKTKKIATAFDIDPSWARRIKQRRRESGETVPRPMGGARVIKIDVARLVRLVGEDPDATLAELRDRLGAPCGISAICMALRRAGLSFKKRRSTHRSATARTSSKDARDGGRSSARPSAARKRAG